MTCTLKISCLDLPILFGSYTFETEQKILKEKKLKSVCQISTVLHNHTIFQI